MADAAITDRDLDVAGLFAGVVAALYPPFILASTASALGWNVSVFFTFYGLNIIHRDFEKRIKVGPVGNPAMPTFYESFWHSRHDTATSGGNNAPGSNRDPSTM